VFGSEPRQTFSERGAGVGVERGGGMGVWVGGITGISVTCGEQAGSAKEIIKRKIK